MINIMQDLFTQKVLNWLSQFWGGLWSSAQTFLSKYKSVSAAHCAYFLCIHAEWESWRWFPAMSFLWVVWQQVGAQWKCHPSSVRLNKITLKISEQTHSALSAAFISRLKVHWARQRRDLRKGTPSKIKITFRKKEKILHILNKCDILEFCFMDSC